MSLFVKHEGHLWPRTVFEPPLDIPKGECVHCGGTGQRIENIDPELHDVLVPCDFCRVYCKGCDRYVKKSGHDCIPAKARGKDGTRTRGPDVEPSPERKP